MVSPDLQLAMLMDGFRTRQMLYVAAKLGVAEVLAQGPRTGPEVAEAVGADPTALTIVLLGERHPERHHRSTKPVPSGSRGSR